MKFKGFAAVAILAAVVATPAVWAPKALSQDASSETAKRKVRNKVEPQYPATAKAMNITGRVRVEATISADGHVLSTRVIGGSPLLVNAAVDALEKWRFEPAAKDTTEVFEFDFDRSQ
jgi:TonB family protein